MVIKNFYPTFWIILLFSPILCLGKILENNDFEIWLRQAIDKKIKERLSYRIDAEARYGDNASSLYLLYTQFLFVYQPVKWMDLAMGYRHQGVFSLNENHWVTVYNPLADVTFHFSSRKWEWVNRNRIQYLITSLGQTFWQYRNRLRLISPWKFTKAQFHFYIDNEVFFVERRGFFQDRFSVGALAHPTDHLTLEAFYMLRHLEIALANDEWSHQHILGLFFTFKF